MSNDGNYEIQIWDPGLFFPGTPFKSSHSESKLNVLEFWVGDGQIS